MAASAPTPRATGSQVEGRCGYYVAKKKRFCRMVAAAGKRFCGEHAGAAEGESARKRILCPLDPKHTVYEDQLAKHLKKCNSREKPTPDFFVQDINAGLKDETEISEQLVPISSLSEEQLENLIMKLKKATEGLNSTLRDQIMSHPALHDALTDPKNGDSATKHLKQQVDGKHRKKNAVFERLQIDIQHLCLNKIPVLSREKLPVVGIGKHLCGVATDLALRCLVGACGARGEEGNEEPAAKRMKNDTADRETPAVAEEGSYGTVPEQCSPVAGIVIALCCHHRCDWRHYVGREHFRALGLGALEFHYFQRMSSWATCGLRDVPMEVLGGPVRRGDPGADSEEHDGGGHPVTESHAESPPGCLTVEEKKEVGRLCKLLIDHGRAEYLRRHGFRPALQRYTEPAVSPENVLLTAVPHRPCPAPGASA
ncbi:tRNA:m(4)X modification enzyme TRM13 homolog isoform X4 [Sturnira hondurensis]|uniref:tRNA:m(4)X modification enzyme TRM13 homolog isoform X4 n=1 Tax=Sturnira hondurensis TaxID=192404 RepID=UPI00187AE86E|nr:tRNA:m(4)X modification enzyme TRM13 homolog isoform X4 [Sturnira hondurensis]